MTKHLRNEIERLKKRILALSAYVEGCVYNAVKSFTERDITLARKCIEADEEVDQMEVEVEEDCLKILALHQPVANDLRFIVAVLKINNDLERIGDLASNISDNAIFLATKEKVDVPFDLLKMAEKVKTMLKQSIDSLVNLDAPLAKQVCERDDDIDSLHREMYRVIEKRITEQPERIDCLIRFLSSSRQLERIADHATNIAEDVIYMIEGEIYRHRVEEFNVG
jgi:phosphate transport system protein